jgi:hypothetical protein
MSSDTPPRSKERNLETDRLTGIDIVTVIQETKRKTKIETDTDQMIIESDTDQVKPVTCIR